MCQKIFQPHLKNFLAEESSIHHKIYQDESLKIHTVLRKDHSNLYMTFQMPHYLNKMILNFDLQPSKEYFILTFKHHLTQIKNYKY
jgi:hypothetical protein